MKPEQLAKYATPIVILGLLVFVVAQKNGWDWRPSQTLGQQTSAAGATPQDTVNAVLDAARSGDWRAYLDLYTGAMRVTLDQTVREKGEVGFRDYLKSRSAELKGLAVFDPKPVSDTEVQIRVEYVYPDRNEAQLLTLEKAGLWWKISRMENAETVKSLVPYGTPVK